MTHFDLDALKEQAGKDFADFTSKKEGQVKFGYITQEHADSKHDALKGIVFVLCKLDEALNDRSLNRRKVALIELVEALKQEPTTSQIDFISKIITEKESYV